MRRADTQGRQSRRLIAGILLAAGRSSRFGRQKLLEPFKGEPLVHRAARAMVEGGLDPVIAVVSEPERFASALSDLDVVLVPNPDVERGVSRSIAVGLEAVPADAAAVLIGVADQPLLGGPAIQALAEAFLPGSIVVPRYGDHAGNPRIFDRRYFPALRGLTGDQGAHGVPADPPEAMIEVALPVEIGLDVDRPSDWAALS